MNDIQASAAQAVPAQMWMGANRIMLPDFSHVLARCILRHRMALGKLGDATTESETAAYYPSYVNASYAGVVPVFIPQCVDPSTTCFRIYPLRGRDRFMLALPEEWVMHCVAHGGTPEFRNDLQGKLLASACEVLYGGEHFDTFGAVCAEVAATLAATLGLAPPAVRQPDMGALRALFPVECGGTAE